MCRRAPQEGAVDPSTAELERDYLERTKVKNVDTVVIDGHSLQCWYSSPFPDEVRTPWEAQWRRCSCAALTDSAMQMCTSRNLYFCGFCLKYFQFAQTFVKHKV